MNLDLYWNLVERQICSKCIDGDSHGHCLLPECRECALKTHFPQVIQSVLSVKSNSVEPYTAALRRTVCATCVHQSSDGKCRIRSSVDCGLDRYYPLVIAAIEEVRAEAA